MVIPEINEIPLKVGQKVKILNTGFRIGILGNNIEVGNIKKIKDFIDPSGGYHYSTYISFDDGSYGGDETKDFNQYLILTSSDFLYEIY